MVDGVIYVLVICERIALTLDDLILTVILQACQLLLQEHCLDSNAILLSNILQVSR